MAPKILIADDEPQMRSALRVALESSGYETTIVSDGQKALEEAQKHIYDMVITDMKMPGLSGLELLECVRKENLAKSVVLITAFGTIDAAVSAMKMGAMDFLRKPFSMGDLEAVLSRAFGEPFADGKPETHQVFASKQREVREIVTSCATMKEILYLAKRVALSELTVLITGESGTGKELLARLVHQESSRSKGPFVAVNCAAVPDNLLESELFGYEKGAFTGANASRQGKFEMASGGTILLDEISEMPMVLQAKLLRVLQEREVDRVGGRFPIPIDTRVIVTTNSNLAERVKEGTFREDLFYRVNVVPMELMPLRERKEDIISLSSYFCQKHSQEIGKPTKFLSEEATKFVLNHEWPGNVRELENAIQRGVALSTGDRIEIYDLIWDERRKRMSAPEGISEKVSETKGWVQFEVGTPLAEMERKMILATLKSTNDNRTQAAEQLGITVRTLRNKLNQYREEGFFGGDADES
ncbi:MAG: sigma-54-dependent Fis family transcriptional regulator [Candidatus Coatesbacteria bacterium]|nr:sigma-54-dependent Fis family transcriptional regulator [Candidatus Coatesbacteria bacterium]